MGSLVIYDHSKTSLNSYQLIISFQTAFNSCLLLFVLSELLDSPYAIVVGGGGGLGEALVHLVHSLSRKCD